MSTVKRMQSLLATALAGYLVCAPVPAQAQESLRGEPFSDPSLTFPMAGDWVRKPIRHEAWAGSADVVVTLEQDVHQFLEPLIRAYAKRKGIRIAVQEGTCGISAGALSRRAVDIGGFCCPPAREDRLPGLRFHTIGIVAKAVIVNSANPIGNLTLQQARDVFGGKVFRWSELRAKGGSRARTGRSGWSLGSIAPRVRGTGGCSWTTRTSSACGSARCAPSPT